MNKILASLKTLVTSAAVWHFLNDFGALFLAGAGALGAYIVVPADGNWKAAIGAFLLAALNVAIPAFRRAWAENSPALLTEAQADAGAAYSGIPWYDIESAVNLLEKTKDLDPVLSQQLEDWLKKRLGVVLAEAKVPSAL